MGNYDYKSNSDKSREATQEGLEPKKVDKIISGEAKVRKRSDGAKFRDSMLADNARSLKDYVIYDVLIPSFKKLIMEIVTNGTSLALYGEPAARSRSNGSKINYARISSDRDRDEYRYDRRHTRSIFDYDEIIFDNRGDAEVALDQMFDILDTYKIVHVGDLYDLAGVDTDNHQAYKYGWSSLENAKVVETRDGYILKLPRPMPID